MRKKIIVGNWKMNTNLTTGSALVQEINNSSGNLKSIVLVPFTHIKTLQTLSCENVFIGAQNVSQFESGAYTGEISAEMLAAMGVKYITIGHSERRTIFNEKNEEIAQKVLQALKHNLHPIVCCGEPLAIRKSNKYIEYVQNQLSSALFNLIAKDISNLTIAYEPIWAIGTGETASAAQAQEVHLFIRNMLQEKFGNKIANNVTILYGGSVKPSNAKELFSENDIDGALVGGASLDAESFVEIIKSI